jgi:hypothetical protein
MSFRAVNLSFECNDVSYFDTVIVKKNMARKLKKHLKNNPDNYFYYGDGDEVKVKFSDIGIRTSSDESVISSIRETKEFTGTISSLCIFEILWSSNFENDSDYEEYISN